MIVKNYIQFIKESSYKIFESDTNYSIYDWFEDIKSSQWGWGRSKSNKVNESSLKVNT
jgi:hypothetical protein